VTSKVTTQTRNNTAPGNPYYTLFISENTHRIILRIHRFLSKIQCYEENILNHLEEFTKLLLSTITNIVDVDSLKSHSDSLIQALRLQLDKIHNSEPSQIEMVHDELVKELISRNKTK
jgi:hypothetical protein